jgi:hypothetical protein
MKSESYPHTIRRRRLLLSALATGLLPLMARARDQPGLPRVEVWLSPTCGCCKDWIAHLQANGFRTVVYETGNTAMRGRLGIAAKYGSCHTARVGGYAIEGHVPAADIRRLLKERPQAIGLAVPGMPVGSPGMDGAEYKGRKDPYNVLLIAADGSASIYQPHP